MRWPKRLKPKESCMPPYVLAIPLILVLATAAGSTLADDRPSVPAVNNSAISGVQNMGSPEDVDAIKRAIVEMTEGFNKHDAVAATRMYTPDADFVSVRGEMGIGRDRAEKSLDSIFKTRAKNATLKTEDVKIRFIRPDVAIVHVTNELSGLVTSDGQTPPPHKELSMRVFVKNGGQWQVAAFHNTMIRPFEAPLADKPNR